MQEKTLKILSKAISLIGSNSRKFMTCLQYFYDCDQRLKQQVNLAGSLNNELQNYKFATKAYGLLS